MSFQLLPNTIAIQTKQDAMPSRTYAVDWASGRMYGYCDGNAAMQQAIFKHLQTWLGAHDIYDDEYGFEARGLVGKDRGLIESELKRRVKEALLIDERIKDVRSFSFFDGESKDSIAISFSTLTKFGEITSDLEVKIA